MKSMGSRYDKAKIGEDLLMIWMGQSGQADRAVGQAVSNNYSIIERVDIQRIKSRKIETDRLGKFGSMFQT